MKFSNDSCPVCGCTEFAEITVLWPELINAWELSEYEAAYINKQQGFYCQFCSNNFRAMGLSAAITNEYRFNGTLDKFCDLFQDLSVLEINLAANLTPFLKKLPLHKLIEYPQFDMTNLDIVSDSFDLIVHSDTLEHISDPQRALIECHRVLKNNGKCIFTVPIVVDRTTRSRAGLPNSYHGQAGITSDDLLVFTEFGADIWRMVINSGFNTCKFFNYEYPSSIVLIAKKC